MITRVWHGRTKPENEEAYLKFLLNEGTEEYKQVEGNLSVKIWKKKENDCSHFWTVTEWIDSDSIKSFAGENFTQAKYYPFDEGMLLEFEKHVHHYECYDVSHAKIKNYIRQLEQIYAGGNWLAESFVQKLNGVTEDQVFKIPIPGVHSIAEIIWHCIYWRVVSIHRLKGDNNYRDETIEKFNFLPLEELKQKGWYTIMRELEETQTALINLLAQKDDRFLEDEYEPGKSHGFLIEGTIQHDAYHLGQVGLVLKILSVLRT